jgi:hypothetical protein
VICAPPGVARALVRSANSDTNSQGNWATEPCPRSIASASFFGSLMRKFMSPDYLLIACGLAVGVMAVVTDIGK